MMGKSKVNVAVALLLCTASATAWAQQPPSGAVGADVSGSPQPVEEIVVTSQRREQSILKVPVAVTAVTGAALKQEISERVGRGRGGG